MGDEHLRRDTGVFRAGLAVLVLLPVAVFLPLGATTGDAPGIFFVQMVVVASWVAWFARRRARTGRRGER